VSPETDEQRRRAGRREAPSSPSVWGAGLAEAEPRSLEKRRDEIVHGFGEEGLAVVGVCAARVPDDTARAEVARAPGEGGWAAESNALVGLKPVASTEVVY